MTAKNRKNGFALLIVLAAIAIMMLLYFVQMDTLFEPSIPTAPAEIEKRPWTYENLLVPAGKTLKKPKAPKPLLTEPFELSGSAERNSQPRGQVKIAFDTDGRIMATWQTEYAGDGKTHAITTQMTGNVSTKMTYEADGRKDETRLFFIAKGQYVHLTETQTGTTREQGDAYAIGWLAPDRTAEGFVTITTDQTWSMEFAFTAAP